MKLTLQQLSATTGVAERTIRYYIQRGLLPAPEGHKRGAHYTQAHAADLLRIRHWQESGLSLEAIGDLLQARSDVPLAPTRPGAVEVRSHLTVADGVELVVAPDRCRLTQAQLRQLFHQVEDALAQIRAAAPTDDR